MQSSNSNEPLVIGIDVGGTNTDAVAFCGTTVRAAAKVPTRSQDYASSVVQVVGLLEQPLDQVAAVFVGTTAFVNALAEGRGLDPIAMVRLCGPSARAIEPLQDFPPSLAKVVSVGTWFAAGGLYFDGQGHELALDKAELATIALQIASTGAKTVVVSGTFSPCNSQQEEQAAQVLRQHLPDNIRVVISCQSAGRLGLLARENAACLDATLFGAAQRVAFSIQRALLDSGLPTTTRFFFTANDGSVIGFDQAAKSPLKCVACGPTNSIRGAAFLAGSFQKEDNAACDRIVLDVGGTTTDAGCLVGGVHPRRANAEATIAGVRCNQRTTDVVSIALGGGSIVSVNNDSISIGPESVGADITTKAVCFGGSVCTATCVAVTMGMDMVFASNVTSYSEATPRRDTSLELHVVKKAWDTLQGIFLDLVERTRTDARPIQVLVVGGGAGLVDSDRLAKSLGPDCQVTCPEKWASVANACGSALAQAAGEVETIADLSEQNRDAVLNDLKAKACNMAGLNAVVTECEEGPLAYLPGKISRVYVRAVAPLDLSRNSTAEVDDRKQGETNVSSISEPLPALRLADPPPVSPSPPNVKDGVWKLSEYDAICLSIGCGILGCGGGGSTRHGLLQLLHALQEGRPIRVISANSVPDDALVVPCAYMGAPTVSLERCESPDPGLVAAINRNLSLESDPDDPVYIMLSEVGGGNGLKPLLVGGVMDRPVVDADLMGRAFPELQMTTTAITGCPQMPTTVSDAFGRCVCLTLPPSGDTDDDFCWVERVLRPVCVEFGCSAGLADPIVRGKDLGRTTVCGSLSRARRIGDCILRSAHPKEAVDRLLEVEAGKLLFEGKVTDVQRETSKGFAKGKLTILGEDSTSSVVIEFQNEFLIARTVDSGGTRMIGCVPDIISLIDVDSAKPIATEEVRFGFRVYVILLTVPQILRTPEALRVVGPKAFGFEESYDSILAENAGSLLEMSIAEQSYY